MRSNSWPNLPDMRSTTRTLARKQYKWRIYRIHSRPTEFLGSVTASDEESTLEKAANAFRIAIPS
jgi:1,2-phenylacetyl-CoA epoxidase PaaB subunit